MLYLHMENDNIQTTAYIVQSLKFSCKKFSAVTLKPVFKRWTHSTLINFWEDETVNISFPFVHCYFCYIFLKYFCICIMIFNQYSSNGYLFLMWPFENWLLLTEHCIYLIWHSWKILALSAIAYVIIHKVYLCS